MNQEPTGMESAQADGDELRSSLEQTRERVSADVEALGAKLSPANLKTEAKQAVTDLKTEAKQAVTRRLQHGADRVRDGVDRAETSVLDFCRENPIPLSLIGAGLGLLIYNSRRGKRRLSPDHAVIGRSTVYDQSQEALGAASNRFNRLKDGLEHGVERAGHAAGATMDQARATFEQLEQRALEQARHARQLADHTLEEQPLVLGAIALGAGLAVGLSLPSTESEDRLIGHYRERFVEKAKRRVGELGGVADRAVDAAKSSLSQEQNRDAQSAAE